VVAPKLATVVVVIACMAFPQQTSAVVLDAAEKRVAQIVKVMEASLTAAQHTRDEGSTH